MIILRRKKVVKVTIWAVAIAFMLSIFLYAGMFFLDRQTAKKRADELAKLDEQTEDSGEVTDSTVDGEPQDDPRFKVVATYLGGEVLAGDIINLYNNQLDPELKRYFRGAEGQKRLVEQYALEKVQLRMSEKFCPELNQEVEDMVVSMAKSHEQAGGLDAFLLRENLTMDKLKSMLKDQILVSKRAELITGGKTAATEEITEYYEQHREEHYKDQEFEDVRNDIKLILETTVTDQEIEIFYQAHLDRFREPDEVLLHHILLKPESDQWREAAEADITQAKIASHYASLCTTTDDFRIKGLATVRHIFVDPRLGTRMVRVVIAEERCRTYYSDHKQEFNTREKRKVRHLFLDPRTDKRLNGITVEEQDIKDYYESNLEQFTSTADGEKTVQLLQDVRETIISDLRLDAAEKAAAELANTIKKQLADEEITFEEAVTQHSDGTSSSNGGDIGYLNTGPQRSPAVLKYRDELFAEEENILPPPVEQAVFGLEQDGGVSSVVDSALGYHLFKLEEIVPSRPQTFEEARNDVEEKLRPSIAWEDAFKHISQAYNELREGAGFSDMAVKYSEAASVSNGGLLDAFYLGKLPPDLDETVRSRLIDEVASTSQIYPEVVEAVLALKPGKFSDIIKTDKGYHLIELSSIELKPFLPLKLVTSEVKTSLAETMAKEKAREKLESIRERTLAEELTFEEAAKQFSEGRTAAEGGKLGYVKKDENLSEDPEKLAIFRDEIASFTFRMSQGRYTPATSLESIIAERVFQMSEGEITPVLETRYGLHVVKVKDIKQGPPRALDDAVKGEIKDSLVKVIPEERLKEEFETKKESYRKPEGDGSEGDSYFTFEQKRDEIKKSLEDARNERLFQSWQEEARRSGNIKIIHEHLKYLEEL